MNNCINPSLAFFNLLPEMILSLMILVQLLFNVSLRKLKETDYFMYHTVVFIQYNFIILFLFILLLNCNIHFSFSNNIFYNDQETKILKIFLLFFSILAINPIYYGFFLRKLDLTEFYTLFLFSILSGLLLISAGNFISIYLLIEMQALCFYVLTCFKRNSVFSSDAGVKYFIFGAIISSILLFGISLLYGALGTLNLQDINLLLYDFPLKEERFQILNVIIILSLTLICIAILFKLGVVPFHIWVPDVYEGSPISTTIILSYLPKIVFFNLFLKLFYTFDNAFKLIMPFFLITGVLSALIGAFFALTQNRLKRFLIYSSISQIGFPLIILSSVNLEAFFSIYFFIIIYIINSILMWTFYVFLIGTSIRKNSFAVHAHKNPVHLSDFNNLFEIDKRWALLFVFTLFSSAGLPPFAGFLSKFFVILQLVINDNNLSALLLLFIASISTFYYVKIIKIIFFEKMNVKNDNENFSIFINEYFFTFNNFLFLIILIISSFILMDSWLNVSQFIFLNGRF